jgi:hypothetical protein
MISLQRERINSPGNTSGEGRSATEVLSGLSRFDPDGVHTWLRPG